MYVRTYVGTYVCVSNLQFRFDVRATDQGNPAMLYKTAKVSINVWDINDNAPVFSDNPFTGEIARDDTQGNKIVTVSIGCPAQFRTHQRIFSSSD